MSFFERFSFKNLTPDEMVLRVSGLSLMTALILIVLKVLALVASGSMAIMASLADSGLDLLASLITFLAIRFARKPPDANHPFGHGKAEAFSALFQAGLVFSSAALILREGLGRLGDPQPVSSGGLAIAVMVVSIILTSVLVMVQGMAVRASGSVAIKADRAHYMVDLLSNGVALIGVMAAVAGYPLVDALAGIFIGLWLVWGAIGVLRQAADHLMDHALDEADIERIRSLVLADPDIRDVHRLRTRVSGPYILIQMHIVLAADHSLVSAHQIILSAENRLLAAYPNADILIHPDPEGAAEPHGGVFGHLPNKV